MSKVWKPESSVQKVVMLVVANIVIGRKMEGLPEPGSLDLQIEVANIISGDKDGRTFNYLASYGLSNIKLPERVLTHIRGGSNHHSLSERKVPYY